MFVGVCSVEWSVAETKCEKKVAIQTCSSEQGMAYQGLVLFLTAFWLDI